MFDCGADNVAFRLELMGRMQGGCTTGMTWVTPSPESMTVPVRERSWTLEEVQDAARARTAWTAM